MKTLLIGFGKYGFPGYIFIPISIKKQAVPQGIPNPSYNYPKTRQVQKNIVYLPSMKRPGPDAHIIHRPLSATHYPYPGNQLNIPLS